MSVYYNENDKFAAAWLRELIRERAIPAGDVDERDIQLVQPADLAGYEQCHFFAGIGGWAYALELAGWSGPVWTGSCPCQPFSSAGKRGGFEDARHLWPSWFRLIRECRPPVVFGEQVARGGGLAWFDLVSTDLEREGYAVGAADLPAASVGAPHIRQRLFFVADTVPAGRAEGRSCPGSGSASGRGATLAVADASSGRRAPILNTGGGEAAYRGRQGDSQSSSGVGVALGNVASSGLQAERKPREQPSGDVDSASPWSVPEWLLCSDGKARPTQPGLFPLASGIPNRVGALRGAGNSISPQVAAAFVRAYLRA